MCLQFSFKKHFFTPRSALFRSDCLKGYLAQPRNSVSVILFEVTLKAVVYVKSSEKDDGYIVYPRNCCKTATEIGMQFSIVVNFITFK